MGVYTRAKRVTLLRATVRAVRSAPGGNHLWRWCFRGSAAHWDHHYARGGDSGPGSYGESAAHKARLVNDFIHEHGVRSIVEFGCGDGNQASMLEVERYIGLDVSKTAIERCIARHAGDASKSFFWYDPDHFQDPLGVFRMDCALSLDVVFHLVEDRVFERYMRQVFHSAGRFAAIYNPDREDGSGHRDPTVRRRKYSAFAASHFPQFKISKHIPPADGGPDADFYVFERIMG